MSEGQAPFVFCSTGYLSLSLFVTDLAPGSKIGRKRERKNILPGLAAPRLVVSLGGCDKARGQTAYKQQTPLSHSSVGWKSEVREAARASSATSPLPGVRLLTSPCVLTWRGPGGPKLTQDSRRALLPFVRALLSSPPLSLTASQRCHLLWVGVQLMDLGGHEPSVHNCLRYHSLLLCGDGKPLATLS